MNLLNEHLKVSIKLNIKINFSRNHQIKKVFCLGKQTTFEIISHVLSIILFKWSMMQEK